MVSLEFAGKVSYNHARPELASPQDTDHWIVWPDHNSMEEISLTFSTGTGVPVVDIL